MERLIHMRENMEREAPLLSMSYGKGLSKHLIYYVSKDRYRVIDIPVLRNKKVIGLSYDWLVLLAPRTGECCLFNPILMNIIKLPQLVERAPWYYECILTKPPTEPGCQILLNCGSEQSFCQVGDNEFERLAETQEYRKLYAMVSFQGQIYGFMGPANKLVTIHLMGNNLEFKPVELEFEDEQGHSRPWVLPYNSHRHRIWLVESPCNDDVELLMIQKTFLLEDLHHGLDFRIFRIDTKKNMCMEVVNIGSRTIFISDNGCGYCYTSKGVKSNCIYYTCISDDTDRNLHLFDLEDKGISLQLPSRLVGYNWMTSWISNTNLFTGFL